MIAKNRGVSRRQFLRVAGLVASGAGLAACAPQTVTVVVTQQVPVQQTVEVQVTKEVEKVVTQQVEVTPTAPPNVVTPQGRTLPADAASLDKQVLYESGGEPKHLDVARDIYNAASALNWGTEPLLRLDENQQIVPAQAEKYTLSPKGDYVEFTLRKDAKWSDGVPITSDDWVFTFKHAHDPAMDNSFSYFYYPIKGVQAYKEGKGTFADVGVEKVDDRVFRLYGQQSAVVIPSIMTYQAAVPAPKHKAEADPMHWSDTVQGFVSSGPMKLTTWEHNKQMVWEANEFYNGPFKPGVQKVIQPMGTANTVWFNSWLNKEIDILPSIGPADLARVRSDPNLNPLLHWFPNFQSRWIALDTTGKLSPICANKKFRQALSHAVDRTILSQQVLNGTEVPGFSSLPPGFPAYNPELDKVQDFNLDKAKQLLADAGYPDGKDSSGKQAEMTITANGRNPIVEFVQQQWSTNLGIKVNVEFLENSVWRANRNKKELGVFLSGYEYDYIDPSNMLTQQWRSIDDVGSLQHRWKNDDFDKLVDQAGKEVDQAKRVELYQSAEKILVDETPAVFLLHQLIFQVWWPYITGIPANKDGNVAYRYLDVSRFQMYIRNDVDQLRKPA